MVIIKKGYEKWVRWNSTGSITIDCTCPELSEDFGDFFFAWWDCILDCTIDLLERKRSIAKDEFIKMKEDAKAVKLIKWQY